MEGFEPYAWLLTVTGERGPEGVPYGSVECGPDAYQDLSVRAAIEENARQAFAHQHPGVAIASTGWYPLHDFGGGELDPDDDGTDACGHGDEPDENCEGCYG